MVAIIRVFLQRVAQLRLIVLNAAMQLVIQYK